MDIQICFNDMKSIYDSILEYIDSEDLEVDEQYNNLFEILESQNILSDQDKIFEVMIIINKISENHNRKGTFFEKIERILSYFTQSLKKFFTNMQIFNFFKQSKRIILYLITNEIITIDESILSILLGNEFSDYQFYFFNEIKDKIPTDKKELIERELCEKHPNSLENIKYLCKTGENDSYICGLIRNDSCEEFISFVNRSNILLTSNIKQSIFETNSFLNNHYPTLIEYAAFFGSIQIFQYLRFTNVELSPSLWIYAIHGRNAEIIHILEDNHVIPYDETFEECLKESLKCHHYEISEYIYNNLLIKKAQKEIAKIIYQNEQHVEKPKERKTNSIFNFFKKIFKKENETMNQDTQYIQENEDSENDIILGAFIYHNYEFMPTNVNNISLFKYFCEYNYLYIVKLFLQNKMINVDDLIV